MTALKYLNLACFRENVIKDPRLFHSQQVDFISARDYDHSLLISGNNIKRIVFIIHKKIIQNLLCDLIR